MLLLSIYLFIYFKLQLSGKAILPFFFFVYLSFYFLPTFLFIFCLSFFLIICYFLSFYLDQLLGESTLPLLILPIFATRETDRQSSRHRRENVFKPHVGPFWACGFGGTWVGTGASYRLMHHIMLKEMVLDN